MDKGLGLEQKLNRVNNSMCAYYERSINGGLVGKLGILCRYPQYLVWNKWYQLKSKKRGSIKTKTFYGRDFYTDSERVYTFGAMPSEINLTTFFIKNLKKTDIFYDVGANCGFYTFLADEFITQGEIHAFEPSPEPFLKLKEGTQQNKCNTILNQVAVADRSGDVFLWDSYNDFASGASTLLDSVVQQKKDNKGVTFNQIKVRCITLDEYVDATRTVPTVIKIDVEGAEGFVIEGAKNLLTKHSPLVTLEVWVDSVDRYAISKKSVEKIMGLGYVPHRITQTGNLEVIKDVRFDAIKKDRYDNWLFRKI